MCENFFVLMCYTHSTNLLCSFMIYEGLVRFSICARSVSFQLLLSAIVSNYQCWNLFWFLSALFNESCCKIDKSCKKNAFDEYSWSMVWVWLNLCWGRVVWFHCVPFLGQQDFTSSQAHLISSKSKVWFTDFGTGPTPYFYE